MVRQWRHSVVDRLAMLLACGCRVQHASDNHAKQQIFYQASLGDPRTFNPILVDRWQFRVKPLAMSSTRSCEPTS